MSHVLLVISLRVSTLESIIHFCLTNATLAVWNTDHLPVRPLLWHAKHTPVMLVKMHGPLVHSWFKVHNASSYINVVAGSLRQADWFATPPLYDCCMHNNLLVNLSFEDDCYVLLLQIHEQIDYCFRNLFLIFNGYNK